MTSIQREVGERDADSLASRTRDQVVDGFADVFSLAPRSTSRETLERQAAATV
jgi:hypothetical protein